MVNEERSADGAVPEHFFLGLVASEEGYLSLWLVLGGEGGPTLQWSSGRTFPGASQVNAVRVSSLLECTIKPGPLRMAPLFDDEEPRTLLSAADKQRLVADALSKLKPGEHGRFEVRWVPYDPRVPF